MIGRLMEALDASPARDDTTIVLWGDNGFHLGEKLHWRKFVLWEEATRVPLIIVPPRGRSVVPRVDEPVSLIDIFPTLFDLCGLPPVQGVDGLSLVGSMIGQSERHAPVLTTWLRGNHSLRHGHLRYTRYSDGGEELYDHVADPYEWNNLARHHRFGAQRAAMSLMLSNMTGLAP
jgi:arylsulfatase A-like enzyme